MRSEPTGLWRELLELPWPDLLNLGNVHCNHSIFVVNRLVVLWRKLILAGWVGIALQMG